MSELNNKREQKLMILFDFSTALIKNENVLEKFKNNKTLFEKEISPQDAIDVVDFMVKQNIPNTDLKKSVNKLINIFYKSINNYQYKSPIKDSFLWFLNQNNLILEKKLKSLKPNIKELNKGYNKFLISKLYDGFKEIQKFTDIYLIKENILFPAIEKHLANYRCIQVMWSFHDDIRNNLKIILKLLSEEKIDLKKFNRTSADIFFNMLAIIFRDNKILFPVIEPIIPKKEFQKMLIESADFNFPYMKPNVRAQKNDELFINKDIVNLPTGALSIEQILLIFNHLPVDITFVDENNKVKFFSAPKSRIFPRTIAVINRNVKNCHPPESVHIVEQIVENFKSGKKDEAVFWMKMKEKFIVIKYFAIRNNKNEYKGVLEVSQEVNDIREMKGEKKLLNWEN